MSAAPIAPGGPADARRNDFYERLAPRHLAPLWERLKVLLTKEPVLASRSYRWALDDARPLLHEAGRMISAKEAERRVLILENPGLPGSSAVTETLYAGFQIILPGEVAPAHRHSASALRLVLEGEGAYTAVDGERAPMEAGDFIVTPNWTWHDHGHAGSEPVVWLDVLDIPLVRNIGTIFAEGYGEDVYPATRPAYDNLYRYGMNLAPVATARPAATASPIFHYPFQRAREALEKMKAAGGADPHLAYKMEYLNPLTGGPAIATISTFINLVPAGMETLPYRTTEGQVICCLQGGGEIVVEEPEGSVSYPLRPKDVVAVPCWRRHTIKAAGDDLILFSASDRGVQQKLGLFREAREAL